MLTLYLEIKYLHLQIQFLIVFFIFFPTQDFL